MLTAAAADNAKMMSRLPTTIAALKIVRIYTSTGDLHNYRLNIIIITIMKDTQRSPLC
jgi:hypothetical protein